MRVICPNCGATYEPPEGLLPSAGGHVQCSACHTRWFFRPERPPATPSEDEILARLATRQPDLRVVRDPAPVPPAPEAAEPEPVARMDTRTLGPERVPSQAPAAPQAAVTRPPVPRVDLTGLAQTAPLQGDRVATAQSPLRPSARGSVGGDAPGDRPRTRVEIDAAAGRRSGGGAGFAAALVVAAAAAAVWWYAEPLAARFPVAAPSLAAYADAISGLRDRIETGLGPLRDRLTEG